MKMGDWQRQARSNDRLDAAMRDLEALESALRARAANVQAKRLELKRRRQARGLMNRRITDHAVLRYLERVKGVDIDAIREEIREMANSAVSMKDGEHHWHESSNVVLIIGDDGQVITILDPNQIAKFVGRKLMNGERVRVEAAADACERSTPTDSMAIDNRTS